MSDDSQLDNLEKRIIKAKKNLKTPSFKENTAQTQLGRYFNSGIELVAGVLAGVGVGLFVDWAFKISPWGLISFFIMGSIAGMLNVYRSLTKTKGK